MIQMDPMIYHSYIDMIIWSSNQPLCRVTSAFWALQTFKLSGQDSGLSNTNAHDHRTGTVLRAYFWHRIHAGRRCSALLDVLLHSGIWEVDAILYLQGLSKYEVDLNQKGTYVIEFHSFDFRCMFFQMVLNEIVWH